jgi:transposase
MVLADGQGIPLGVSVHSASPAEVTLAEETLSTVRVGNGRKGHPRQNPDRLIADRGYDSDPLRARLAKRGIEQITPHRSNRKKAKTQDGRPLRRYRRRWKIERSIAWLGNYRRLLVRHDRDVDIFRAFVHIACLILVCRYL